MRDIFPFFPGNFAQLSGLFILLGLVLQFLTKKKDLKLPISPKILAFICVLIMSQIIVMSYNFLKMNYGTIPFYFEKFIAFILFVILTFYFFYNLFESKTSFRRFIQGIYLSSVFLFFILSAQFLFVTVGFCQPIVRFVGQFLELGWNQPGLGNYAKGSSVETLFRLNGLDQEPAYLAAHLAIVFLPFALAGILKKVNYFPRFKKAGFIFNWIVFLLALFFLVVSKTTTGLILCGVAIIAWILPFIYDRWFGLNGQQKVKLSVGIILGLAFSILLILKITYLRDIFNYFLLKKLGSYVSAHGDMARSGGTIGLWRTFIHYPLFGVGDNFTAPFLLEFIPQYLRQTKFYLNTLLPERFFPVLSIILGLLAKYGLVIMSIVGIWWKNLWEFLQRRSSVMYQQSVKKQISKNESWENAIFPAFIFFTLFYLLSSIAAFSYNFPCYVFMLMFFVVYRSQEKG
jgi:hypothetical protein